MESTYKERRRAATHASIKEANSDPNALRAMLEVRQQLAQVYAEEGAAETALAIETVDIPLIKAALEAVSPRVQCFGCGGREVTRDQPGIQRSRVVEVAADGLAIVESECEFLETTEPAMYRCSDCGSRSSTFSAFVRTTQGLRPHKEEVWVESNR